MNIKENAKSDWMSLVKKQKKRQKGLPALSTLNTNAGNVEKNIEIFNAMQPEGNVNVDASNGNISGMTESIFDDLRPKDDIFIDDDTVVLYYDRLYLEDVPTGRVFSGGYYEPDEPEETNITIDYEYIIDKNDLIEFLQDLPEVQSELDVDDDNFDQLIEESLYELSEKYKNKILEHFEYYAKDEARDNFDPNMYFEEYDCHKNNIKESLDDNFDMSMRTLL